MVSGASRLVDFRTISLTNTDHELKQIWSLSVFLLTLAASLMLPRLVDLLVQEKDKGQYEMIRIQGGKLTAYWISQYLYSLAMSSFFCILTILVAFVFKVQPYSDVGLLQSLGIMLVWAHCQVGLVFLISGLFKRPIASGIFSSIVVVASGLVSTLPVEGTGNLPSGAIPTAYALFPPFGIISVVNTLYAAGDNRAQVTLFVTSQIIFTFIVGTAYGLLGMYIHAVRPTSTGFGVDPLLGLGRLINKRSKQRNLEAVDQEPAFDGDVQEEENAVLDSWRDGNHSDKALTIIHLRKVFSKDKVAVRDLTLRMSPGDAFGLLGPNGAGKSTTLGMITGLVKPTRGEVYYGGNRLEDLIARGELARYVGFCPQQDIVWPDMTVEEHLRFFAQMRGGAPATQTVRDYVKGIAATVGLDDALKKRASQLSGGMKRRLCIGIALTGDPAVVVLDEPTSGLDPSNRRHIWQVIETIKSSRTVTNQKRSVLITTHSMVEADTLCSKIAIVTEGKVQAFGSQMRLKARYGDGLKLAVQFMVQVPLPRRAFDILRSSPSADDLKLFEDHDLIEYLKEVERARTDSVIKMARGIIAPGAYLDVPPSTDFTAVLLHFQNKFIASVQNASTTITWKVNAICGFPKGTAMSTVFTGLGPLCQSANILNWELNPTTLEDVFVKVVENNS
ncbi:P-loop containing nucleoside triphosphate hydrolase protein [Cladochytrium replicatum]|nr:P-loop containing nucleoside triphosphate hydrolase protein [Cladochytrium replicatum]